MPSLHCFLIEKKLHALLSINLVLELSKSDKLIKLNVADDSRVVGHGTRSFFRIIPICSLLEAFISLNAYSLGARSPFHPSQ